MESSVVRKYANRFTGEKVTAMRYNNIHDFDTLYRHIGDIYPTLTPAHTRIYEGNWIVRTSTGNVEFICCAHGEQCFNSKYEIYR